MTAQINDTVFHRKIKFALVGASGSGLFDVATLGFKPAPTCSACWRAYVAHYSVLQGSLALTALQVWPPSYFEPRSKVWEAPALFSTLPKEGEMGDLIYEGFAEPMLFTGSLLLGDRFIRALYVHMGFQAGWKYEHVRELHFDAGRLTSDNDRSGEMAEIRAKAVEE